MSNSYFQFKQFTIRHDRCAMKVGTDGVLLGAWAPLPEAGMGLDIGTGSGLLALMAAQRAKNMRFIGIDIDAEAVAQARENAMESPFSERVSIRHGSLQDFAHPYPPSASMKTDKTGEKPIFQAILCNPPFFDEQLLPPDAQRTTARHTCQLPFADLVSAAATLLSADGYFSVVLPTAVFDRFHRLCFDAGLHLYRRCDVHTTARKVPKRVLACFTHHAVSPQTETLVLQEGNARSEAYQHLCADFYLDGIA